MTESTVGFVVGAAGLVLFAVAAVCALTNTLGAVIVWVLGAELVHTLVSGLFLVAMVVVLVVTGRGRRSR